ncbi:MAG: hypothetical protein K8T26_20125 [Lentisphaerae bacterium]|nr:hypothetical protein [Lentisphaerota bacterium]
MNASHAPANPLADRLNNFNQAVRREALLELATASGSAAPATGSNVNMHAHSFFSFNADGWSPSRVAWEMRQAGLYAAGLCDFDVLDGVVEFLDAGLALGLRTAAHIETRVFLADLQDVEITSPGEPGVTYIMGAGFVALPAGGTRAAAGLAGYRDRARARNVALIARINAKLPDVAIDYARDVQPLTPGGNATERHIIRAYATRARAAFGGEAAVAACWAGVLGKPAADVAELVRDEPRFEEALRARLIKRGGIGYEQPSASTFPAVGDFTAWVRACRALPMITWLDGTSGGERDPRALLDCLTGHGCVAINIVPDRNWNLKNPEERALKIANLRALVGESERRHLPINIGTEMNRQGLPFVDDLDGEALRPHQDAFRRGAQIMVGHSLLLRYADYGYVDAAAAADFPDLARRNAFFAAVGALPPMDAAQARQLRDLGPAKALAWFRAAVR